MRYFILIIFSLALFGCSGDKLSEQSDTTFDDLRKYVEENFENITVKKEDHSAMFGALEAVSFTNTRRDFFTDFFVMAFRYSTVEQAKKASSTFNTYFGVKSFSSGYFVFYPHETNSTKDNKIIKKF